MKLLSNAFDISEKKVNLENGQGGQCAAWYWEGNEIFIAGLTVRTAFYIYSASKVNDAIKHITMANRKIEPLLGMINTGPILTQAKELLFTETCPYKISTSWVPYNSTNLDEMVFDKLMKAVENRQNIEATYQGEKVSIDTVFMVFDNDDEENNIISLYGAIRIIEGESRSSNFFDYQRIRVEDIEKVEEKGDWIADHDMKKQNDKYSRFYKEQQIKMKLG